MRKGFGYMSVHLMKQFIKEKEKLNDEQYFMTTLAYHLAPVMKCKKPSSILTFSKGRRNMHALWDTFKNKLMIIGSLRFYELKRTNNHITVLFFIPRYFMDIIRCPYNSSFLVKLGYGDCDDIDACLQRLKERYKHSKCPHEIGLFLGVPLEDVKSFIKHNGKHYLLCGYWKVYHKPQQRVKLFDAYDQAKNNILKKVTSGHTYHLLAS